MGSDRLRVSLTLAFTFQLCNFEEVRETLSTRFPDGWAASSIYPRMHSTVPGTQPVLNMFVPQIPHNSNYSAPPLPVPSPSSHFPYPRAWLPIPVLASIFGISFGEILAPRLLILNWPSTVICPTPSFGKRDFSSATPNLFKTSLNSDLHSTRLWKF